MAKGSRTKRGKTVSGVVAVEVAEALDRISKPPYTKSFHVGRAVTLYVVRLARKKKAA